MPLHVREQNCCWHRLWSWQPQSSLWAAGTARTCLPGSTDGRSPTFLVGDLQMGFLFGR